jgi:hypothetical protein
MVRNRPTNLHDRASPKSIHRSTVTACSEGFSPPHLNTEVREKQTTEDTEDTESRDFVINVCYD